MMHRGDHIDLTFRKLTLNGYTVQSWLPRVQAREGNGGNPAVVAAVANVRRAIKEKTRRKFR